MIGFVYLLRNEYMPDVYKIGCTERSPHARAEELSKATGVPAPFKIVCFIEVPDFQAVEKMMHDACKNNRISESREFFHHGFAWMLRLFWYHPKRLSFTWVDEAFATDDECIEIEVEDDPWNPPAKPEPPPELKLVQSAGFDEAVRAGNA